MDTELSPYQVLQVDPGADAVVIHAAFRALARRYHPDGDAPDALRMAQLNRAYAVLRDPETRRTHDRSRRWLRPMGPGSTGALPPSELRGFGRDRHDDGPRLDFGRYAGWSLAELARHDPDYLRWLARHSSGIRYRDEIRVLVPDVETVERRASAR